MYYWLLLNDKHTKITAPELAKLFHREVELL